jgi:enediyne polyketide synthase
VPIWKRPDGKPDVNGSASVSAAHSGDITLAVSGQGSLGCDLETVADRPLSVWQDLVGRERVGLAERIADEMAEDLQLAATRIWVAIECLKKAGASVAMPLTLDSVHADGWLFLQAGTMAVATWVAALSGETKRFVFGIALEKSPVRENDLGMVVLTSREKSL